jgi:type I restriction enzyme R subunit
MELREEPPGWGGSLGGELRPAHWEYVPATEIPRQPGDVMIESWLRLALVRLNPEIAAQLDRTGEVRRPYFAPRAQGDAA